MSVTNYGTPEQAPDAASATQTDSPVAPTAPVPTPATAPAMTNQAPAPAPAVPEDSDPDKISGSMQGLSAPAVNPNDSTNLMNDFNKSMAGD